MSETNSLPPLPRKVRIATGEVVDHGPADTSAAAGARPVPGERERRLDPMDDRTPYGICNDCGQAIDREAGSFTHCSRCLSALPGAAASPPPPNLLSTAGELGGGGAAASGREDEELAHLCDEFAEVVCPKLAEALVPFGATAEGWSDASAKFRRIAAALRAGSAPRPGGQAPTHEEALAWSAGYEYRVAEEAAGIASRAGAAPTDPIRQHAINEARVVVAAEQSRWDAATYPEVHQACVNIGAKLRAPADRSTATRQEG